MVSKPITYLGLECILQYTDLNLRLQILYRCPAITAIEKRVPLAINHLEMEENQLSINGTVYRLGVHQHYPEGMVVPEQVAMRNEGFGFQEDLDPYGFPVPKAGDLDEKEMYENEVMLMLKKDQLVKQLELQKMSKRAENQKLQEEIDQYEAQIKLYALRRANVQPPWKILIKITITNPDGISRVKYSEYFRLKSNFSQMLNQFFGFRQPPAKIETWDFNLQGHGLPWDMKLHVKNLICSKDHVDLYKLQQHVHKSSFPLEFVKVDTVQKSLPGMIKTAKKLVAVNNFPASFLGELHCMDFEMYTNAPQDFSAMIRSWLSTEKPIGTFFKFGIRGSRDHNLGRLRNQFNGNIDGEGILTIPMSPTSKIEVCLIVAHITNPINFWGLKFEIVAV